MSQYIDLSKVAGVAFQMITGNCNILKRYLFHLAPYLRLLTLFPSNFTQKESEPTENGDLSEINTSLIKRYFITASKATSMSLGS